MIERHLGAMMGALLTILTLTGCTTTQQSAPALTSPIPELSEGKGRVIFLRQSSVFQAGKSVELEINGASVAKLRNRDTHISTYRRASIISWSAFSPIRALSVRD